MARRTWRRHCMRYRDLKPPSTPSSPVMLLCTYYTLGVPSSVVGANISHVVYRSLPLRCSGLFSGTPSRTLREASELLISADFDTINSPSSHHNAQLSVSWCYRAIRVGTSFIRRASLTVMSTQFSGSSAMNRLNFKRKQLYVS